MIELDEVAFRVFARGEPKAPTLVVRFFHDLHALCPEAGNVGVDVVALQADEPAIRVGSGTVDFAMTAEAKPGILEVAKDDESGRFERYRQAHDVAVEGQEPVEVAAPETDTIEAFDHWTSPSVG